MGQASVRKDATIEAVIARFEQDHNPDQFLLSRSDLVDLTVVESCQQILQSHLPSRIAVIAVGGYGRRELFPYSDIDLLFLVEKENDVLGAKHSLSELLRLLWDSGLQISHSLRTPAECGRFHERNAELHISLLDARLLWGDRALFENLQSVLAGFYRANASRLARVLAMLARQRYGKFNDTPYHLEPNVKESPGGIRDIHLLRWLSQLMPEQSFLRESLQQSGAETREPGAQPSDDSARFFLFTVRCFLHVRNCRDNNLLTFELQDEASQRLPAPPVSPEEWMRIYFQHARRIYQQSLRALEYAETKRPSFLRNFRELRSDLSKAEFRVFSGRIVLNNSVEALRSPPALFRLFSFAGETGLPLSAETQRQIQMAVPEIGQALRTNPPDWVLWRHLLIQPHAGKALTELQETGLLSDAIPAWQKVDSLVVRDFYHRYTVDEHSLVAVQAFDQLLATKDETLSRFHILAKEEETPEVLRFALLMHDIGKGITPGNHVAGSLQAARDLLQIIGAPPDIRSTILFLIEHHLDLSQIMTGRDLEDPVTARFLSSTIDTPEILRRLTLFTFSDISAVNATSMTPWRTEQLWRVYTLGVEQLTRELDSERIRDGLLFTTERTGSPELSKFLDGFPRRYVRTHSREKIERHFELAQISKAEGVAVEIERETSAFLMTVVTHDKPGLFASLCGVLASFGLNIVKGEASSNTSGYVLDLIRFTDPLNTLEFNPEDIERLQNTVKAVVKGNANVFDLLKNRKFFHRPLEEVHIAPKVQFDNQASEHATLIEFAGPDRPRLLYDLTSAITAAGCNIEVVLIDTEGYRAFDVFYLTLDGGKLDKEGISKLKLSLLQAANREI